MNREIAIAIGVGDARPLPYLNGALNGAREFHKWASKLGYTSTLLTDEDHPLTMDGLRLALTTALAGNEPIHRLLLYFAGHGLIREAEEGLWLLSDWNKELRAVAVEVLKRRLSMYYNIEQIAIFADSCRSLANDMATADLTPDGVIGRGPFKQQNPPVVDKFIAAQDSAATFMVPGKSPEEDRCLFSGILMEGLWGTKADAFSKVLTTAITSRSLGAYLKSAVPLLAKRYGRTLVPTVSPTFPEGDDIYFQLDPPVVPPQFPPWPQAEDVISQMLAGGILPDNEQFIFGAEEVIKAEQSKNAGKNLIEDLRRQPQPSDQSITTGFAVQGGNVRNLWAPTDVIAKRMRENWWSITHKAGYHLVNPAPILIEFEDGMFAATTALPRFLASVLRDQQGISALIYWPTYQSSATAGAAEKALAAMEDGSLRADALADIAVELRMSKHYDPVLGVISAYLYDSIGDIGNIRRMAYYYVSSGQPIPYDIALLAQLPGEWRGEQLWAQVPTVPEQKPRTEFEKNNDWTFRETPAVEGPVGGVWPWMRQGWAFLDDPADGGLILIRREMISLTPFLSSGRFVMMNAHGGAMLASLFNLQGQPRTHLAEESQELEMS